MTKFQKELIGRSACGLMALALLLGGYKCGSVARQATQFEARKAAEDKRRPRQSDTGAGHLYTIAAILYSVGGVFALAAVVPVNVLERLLGSQDNNTLHEQPDYEHLRHRRYGDP